MKAIQHGGSGPHTEWQIYKKKKVKAIENSMTNYFSAFILPKVTSLPIFPSRIFRLKSLST